MSEDSPPKAAPFFRQKLAQVFQGWHGYQTSLLHAVTPLTPEQLRWRPAVGRRSLGELIRHVCLGRVTWFRRLGAPGIEPFELRGLGGHIITPAKAAPAG